MNSLICLQIKAPWTNQVLWNKPSKEKSNNNLLNNLWQWLVICHISLARVIKKRQCLCVMFVIWIIFILLLVQKYLAMME